MGDNLTGPTKPQTRACEKGLAFLKAFREVEPGMPSGYMQMFLTVAMNPGHNVTTYARELGLLAPVASRILLEIGKKRRVGGQGLGLVDSVQSTEDLRQFHYHLTDSGRDLLAKLESVLARA